MDRWDNTTQLETPDFEYFTIYDSKVGVYREPMLALNRHDILRQISGLFTDPQQSRNQLFLNAEDFQLFKIGSYSKKTGTIMPCEKEHIANLHELKFAVTRNNKYNQSAIQLDESKEAGLP